MDKTALITMPDTGIRLNLSNFWRIRTWQGGGEFWEHHNQQLIRDSLGQFLPRATVESGNTVLYQLFEGGKELCSVSEPVTAKNPIPHDQAEQLRAALSSFKEKAGDPSCDPDSRKLIDCFRLPDPKKDPELYRVVGSGRRRRLIVLWGAEKEQDSAISPLEAVNMVHAEPSVNPKSSRNALLAAVLIIGALVAAYYFMREFNEKADSHNSPEVVAKPGLDGRLELVSPSSGTSGTPAGIGPVEKPDGSPLSDPSGNPLVVVGVTDVDGKPVKAANGEPLKVGLVSGVDGKPDTKIDSGPFAVAPVTGSDGNPLLGEVGEPVMVGLVTGSVSDLPVEGKHHVVGPDGKPVTGPDGKPVEAGLLTGPDGKSVIGKDGKQKAIGLIPGTDNKPVAIGPLTDAEGKEMKSPDNKPVSIELGSKAVTETPDKKIASSSPEPAAAHEEKQGKTDPTKPPANTTATEGGKTEPQIAMTKTSELLGTKSSPTAPPFPDSSTTVETKITHAPENVTFHAEEVTDKGQKDGKVAVKLQPMFSEPNWNAASSTWKVNGETPSTDSVIEKKGVTITLWLSPGNHRIEVTATNEKGKSLRSEADLGVRVETQLQLKTLPPSGNR